jgi:hypothetical protein
MCGVVPEPQDGVALANVQDRQRPERPIRIGNRALQQPDEPRAQRFDRAAVEQVA